MDSKASGDGRVSPVCTLPIFRSQDPALSQYTVLNKIPSSFLYFCRLYSKAY